MSIFIYSELSGFCFCVIILSVIYLSLANFYTFYVLHKFKKKSNLKTELKGLLFLITLIEFVDYIIKIISLGLGNQHVCCGINGMMV